MLVREKVGLVAFLGNLGSNLRCPSEQKWEIKINRGSLDQKKTNKNRIP